MLHPVDDAEDGILPAGLEHAGRPRSLEGAYPRGASSCLEGEGPGKFLDLTRLRQCAEIQTIHAGAACSEWGGQDRAVLEQPIHPPKREVEG